MDDRMAQTQIDVSAAQEIPNRRSVLRWGAAASLAAAGLATSGVAGASADEKRMDERSAASSDEDVAQLEKEYDTTIGLAAANLATGARVNHRADARFPLLSIFKSLAAAALLRDHDSRGETLDRRLWFPPADIIEYSPITEEHVDTGMTVAQACDAASRYSDNAAANLLMREIGGPLAITRFARSLGDRATRLDRWEPDLNSALPGDERDTTTPAAIGQTYARLLAGSALDAGDRRQLRSWMLDNQTSDERFRAGLPRGWRLADKTGSGDYGTNNDVGVAWSPSGTPFVISVLTRRSAAEATGDDALLADLARLVIDRLT